MRNIQSLLKTGKRILLYFRSDGTVVNWGDNFLIENFDFKISKFNF